MSSTTHTRARRAGSLVAALGVLMAMLLVASPAQAAPIVNLSANDTTITLGDTVTLSWTSADSTTLTAQGDWTGSKAVANGSEGITPSQTGTFTYTLVASNGEDPDSSDLVEVTVAPGPITPAAVTFPDPCTVVIPTTPNVTYFVDWGDGDTEEVEAGTHDGTDFSDGEIVTFFAEANDGFTLADGATTEWDYAAADDCFGEETTLVKVTASCGEVTFKNLVDETLEVLYGSENENAPDGSFTLSAGKSKTVKTNRADLLFIAFTTEDNKVHFDTIKVPQDCDDAGTGNNGGSDHPTVAPAAGIAAR